MTNIALFHSVLGARPGFHAAAERLRAEGHDVTAVDQYDGRTFDAESTELLWSRVLPFCASPPA